MSSLDENYWAGMSKEAESSLLHRTGAATNRFKRDILVLMWKQEVMENRKKGQEPELEAKKCQDKLRALQQKCERASAEDHNKTFFPKYLYQV